MSIIKEIEEIKYVYRKGCKEYCRNSADLSGAAARTKFLTKKGIRGKVVSTRKSCVKRKDALYRYKKSKEMT